MLARLREHAATNSQPCTRRKCSQVRFDMNKEVEASQVQLNLTKQDPGVWSCSPGSRSVGLNLFRMRSLVVEVCGCQTSRTCRVPRPNGK